LVFITTISGVFVHLIPVRSTPYRHTQFRHFFFSGRDPTPDPPKRISEGERKGSKKLQKSSVAIFMFIIYNHECTTHQLNILFINQEIFGLVDEDWIMFFLSSGPQCLLTNLKPLNVWHAFAFLVFWSLVISFALPEFTMNCFFSGDKH